MLRRNVQIHKFLLWIGCVVFLFSSSSVYSQTPAGDNTIRITTGTPTGDGVNRFNITIKFETDGGNKFEVKAEANINGPDQPNPDTATTKAAKIAAAITARIRLLEAASRGIRGDQAVILNPGVGGAPPQPATPLPEVIIRNQGGFKITKIKNKDKTKQKLKVAELVAMGNDTDTGIDLVGNSAGGMVAIQVDGDDRAVVSIATAEKSTLQIEQALVSGLQELGIAATLSASPLDPELLEGEPAFDGGEIQIRAPDRYAITIDNTDSGLDVIMTSDFGVSEPAGEKPMDSQTAILVALLAAVVALFIGYFFGRRRT